MLLEFYAFDSERPPRVPRKKVLINPGFVAAVMHGTVNAQAPGMNGSAVAVPQGEAYIVLMSNGAQIPLSLDNELSKLTNPERHDEPWKG